MENLFGASPGGFWREHEEDRSVFFTDFSEDLSAWITSAVTNMACMFAGARSFQCDLSAWDTSSVTDMSFMFFEALSFNSNISLWSTAEVVEMDLMFYKARSFTCDISEWDIYNVSGMDEAFYECPVDFIPYWTMKQSAMRDREENWARRRAWMMVISPYLRRRGVTTSPLQIVIDVQGLVELITSFL